MSRKKVLEEAFRTETMPAPYQYCKEWECNYCRYNLVCQAVTGGKK